MSEAVIAAAVSGVAGILSAMGGAYLQNRKSAALIAYRLEQLEKKVDKHNNLVERTYHLQEQVAIHEEKIKVVNHRIEDLERSAEK